MGETTVEPVTSCSRMMDLLGAPRDISFFGKLIQREIIYRLLQGSLGARLRAIATFETKCHRVAIGQLVPGLVGLWFSSKPFSHLVLFPVAESRGCTNQRE
jgi:hypothetical protein